MTSYIDRFRPEASAFCRNLVLQLNKNDFLFALFRVEMSALEIPLANKDVKEEEEAVPPPDPEGRPKEESPGGTKKVKPRDIFIGNLSLYTDNAKLRAYFMKFGYVEDVRIMFHPETGRSRRFGFVTFDNPAVVNTVLNTKNHQLDGKVLDIKNAFHRVDEDAAEAVAPQIVRTNPMEASSKVFVGGVGQDVSNDDVERYFSQYGAVTSANLLQDPTTGRNRGFGFIHFATEQAVELVCSVRYHILKGKKVEVKKAMPRTQERLKDHQKSGSALRYSPYAVPSSSSANHLAQAAAAAAQMMMMNQQPLFNPWAYLYQPQPQQQPEKEERKW